MFYTQKHADSDDTSIGAATSVAAASIDLTVQGLLRRGNLRVEKCELKEAGQYFEIALEKSKISRDQKSICDSLAHLLRHSSDVGRRRGWSGRRYR